MKIDPDARYDHSPIVNRENCGNCRHRGLHKGSRSSRCEHPGARSCAKVCVHRGDACHHWDRVDPESSLWEATSG